MPAAKPLTILFHVQHLLGIGHDRRAALIARGLLAAGHRVTVARGGFPVPGVDYGAVPLLQLPPVRATDAGFKWLVDAGGREIDEAWRLERREAALRALHDVAPDLLLVESFPFARRFFRFEMLPLLEAARRAGAATACSVRDILVAKRDPARVAEVVETVETLIDRVLVHGDPALIPFGATFSAADRIADRIRYTGYVAPPASERPKAHGGDGTDEVIVSAGGGAVGFPLFQAALAARALGVAADARWRLLAGPDLPADAFDRLRAAAPAGVLVERARPDFPALLRRCRLSVSQAGYNTLLDLLQAGCRAVLVPFAAGQETEQPIRASLLADRGHATVVEEAGLTAATLAAGIAAALAAPAPGRLALSLDGAARTAVLLEELARRRANW